MSQIRTVCVYCGSGPGTDPAFMEAARRLGELMALDGVGLVYGGGSRGLMGAVATSVLDHGGHVTGIIPEFLQNREQTLKRAQEIIVTPDMHVRKQTMFDKADAFVALLVTDTPEEILPKLRKAAAQVSESEKQGKPETVERM